MEESTATDTAQQSIATKYQTAIIVLAVLIGAEAAVFFAAPSIAGWFRSNPGAAAASQEAQNDSGEDTSATTLANTAETNSAESIADDSAAALSNSLSSSLANVIATPEFEASVNQFMLLSCVIAKDPALSRTFGIAEGINASGASAEELAQAQSQCSQMFTAEYIDAAYQLSGLDDDADGLNNFAEQVYHTSSMETDTDKDGYSDLTEIQNGHDPLTRPEP